MRQLFCCQFAKSLQHCAAAEAHMHSTGNGARWGVHSAAVQDHAAPVTHTHTHTAAAAAAAPACSPLFASRLLLLLLAAGRQCLHLAGLGAAEWDTAGKERGSMPIGDGWCAIAVRGRAWG